MLSAKAASSLHRHRKSLRGWLPISQGYSAKKPHYGIDIGYRASDPDPPVLAIADGEVAMKSKDQYGGLFVVLRHKDLIEGKWCYSCYWHLASFADTYKKGDTVKRGHVLGIMGKTGNASGKHLHFEFWAGPEGVKFSSTNRKRDPVGYRRDWDTGHRESMQRCSLPTAEMRRSVAVKGYVRLWSDIPWQQFYFLRVVKVG